jgi:membrane protein implicated in regulation of membrane protease activity
VPAWIPYTLLRLALFGGVFAVLWLLRVDYWLAAIFAAIISLTIAYIFFAPLHGRVSEEITASRRRTSPKKEERPEEERGEDELAEDRD